MFNIGICFGDVCVVLQKSMVEYNFKPRWSWGYVTRPFNFTSVHKPFDKSGQLMCFQTGSNVFKFRSIHKGCLCTQTGKVLCGLTDDYRQLPIYVNNLPCKCVMLQFVVIYTRYYMLVYVVTPTQCVYIPTHFLRLCFLLFDILNYISCFYLFRLNTIILSSMTNGRILVPDVSFYSTEDLPVITQKQTHDQ